MFWEVRRLLLVDIRFQYVGAGGRSIQNDREDVRLGLQVPSNLEQDLE